MQKYKLVKTSTVFPNDFTILFFQNIDDVQDMIKVQLSPDGTVSKQIRYELNKPNTVDRNQIQYCNDVYETWLADQSVQQLLDQLDK